MEQSKSDLGAMPDSEKTALSIRVQKMVEAGMTDAEIGYEIIGAYPGTYAAQLDAYLKYCVPRFREWADRLRVQQEAERKRMQQVVGNDLALLQLVAEQLPRILATLKTAQKVVESVEREA